MSAFAGGKELVFIKGRWLNYSYNLSLPIIKSYFIKITVKIKQKK
jgi:hypothetical protein